MLHEARPRLRLEAPCHPLPVNTASERIAQLIKGSRTLGLSRTLRCSRTEREAKKEERGQGGGRQRVCWDVLESSTQGPANHPGPLPPLSSECGTSKTVMARFWPCRARHIARSSTAPATGGALPPTPFQYRGNSLIRNRHPP